MWVKKLFPETIARFSTKYNHDIRVVKERGTHKLLVNGSRQSGEYIERLWQHAFSEFGIIPAPGIRSILVLGVAGGTVIHLLRAIYPDASIHGVDIDAKMIEIGKKHFGLGYVPKLTMVTSDANLFVKTQKRQWDMIVVDLFVGATIPPFVGDDAFLKDIKRLLVPHGKLVINYLYELEYKKLSDLFFVKLQSNFPHVRDVKIYYNRFFFVVK